MQTPEKHPVPLIVYYTFQKQFIRGILAGALKG
jgi:ABC-type glycerol-3-phosphate transport system permease component